MFSIPTIKSCPVTAASRGVITFDKATAGQIAGAARDDIEWILLLVGERSTDGYEVRVTGLTVPTQMRGRAHADIPEITLTEDIVGVMHLHPWWGQAGFSHIDDTTLNPRFPSSVVVSPASNYLGFSYEATGKVILPCGAMGMVDFELAVAEAGELFAASVIRASHETAGLGDCTRYDAEMGELTYTAKTACGLERTMNRVAIFGADGTSLLDEVRKQTIEPPKPKSTSYTTGNTLSKKERKRLKKARRNGLVKLDRPTHADGCMCSDCRSLPSSFEQLAARNEQASYGGTGYTWKGGCDECEIRGELLMKHHIMDQWLCRKCFREADEIIDQCMRQEDESVDSRDGESFRLLGDGSVTTSEELEGEPVVITIDGDNAEDNYREVQRSM